MSTVTREAPPGVRVDSPILSIPHIPLAYDCEDADESALRLVKAYAPEWQDEKEGSIKLVRFTEGITNTLIKATRKRTSKIAAESEQDAILLRSYGEGTDILIDRERELNSHILLASRGLAPPLLARFNNGLMYRFIVGDVCSPEDLRRPEVFRQVARRLGEWHGSLPIAAISKFPTLNGKTPGQKSSQMSSKMPEPTPNTWTVTRQWIDALPLDTDQQKQQKLRLKEEFGWIYERFSGTSGLFGKDYVFGHCDLLSGNVIIQPAGGEDGKLERPVSFIDYEYATPSPAAFDIANHFAEWAGFDCDHAGVPTKSQRYDFLRQYVASFYYNAISEDDNLAMEIDMRAAIDQLYKQVDEFRGLPGFYWGVWSLIQAQISQIDFDYASYAEIRLGEYWAWKAEMNGSRIAEGEEMPLRERRWAEE